jgi:uncharacterized membrane protein YhhN
LPALWWIAGASGLVYLVVLACGAGGLVRGVKVVPALALAAALAPVQPVVAAGMALSAVGDGFLLEKKRFLLPGLGAFLVAHVVFVVGFLRLSRSTPAPGVIAGLAALALAVLVVVRPRSGGLRVAVPIYAVTLCAMVSAATTLGPLGVAGGLSFLLSDALLATDLFKRPLPGGHLPVMVTYYAALLLLGAAVLLH